MKKQVVFFDFDQTKIDTVPVLVAHINRHFSIVCERNDLLATNSLELVINKYLPKERHMSREEAFAWLTADFLCSADIHDTILPIPGMVEILPALAKRYEIWTVTARQKIGMQVIKRVLDKHVPNCVTGIHCVWERRGDVYHHVSKREFISSFGSNGLAFFDDSPTEILDAKSVIRSYLFDPHGQHDHRSDIEYRVRTWKEIGDILL